MALRSRKVDFKRRFAVLRYSECVDLDETVSLGRGVPTTIKTGVDKEEEDEHHLRAALDANQAGVEKSTVVIPTPDASRPFAGHEKYYPGGYQIPKAFVKFSAQMEDYIGCPYCLDEADDAFLAKWRAESASDCATDSKNVDVECVVPDDDLFEVYMYTLERFGNEQATDVPTLDQCSVYIRENEPLLLVPQTIPTPEATLSKIFSYWVHRRYTQPRPFPVTNNQLGRPIVPPLRVDEVTNNPKRDDSDPYICFRKRDLRPTRKHTKRVDTASLEKLKKLHRDLIQVRGLLDLVGEREETRRELLTMDTAFFEKRCLVRKMKKVFGVAETEDGKKKKRKTAEDSLRPSSIKIKIRNPSTELLDVKSPMDPVSEQMKVSEQVSRRKAEDAASGFIDLTECPFIQSTTSPKSFWESPLEITSTASYKASSATDSASMKSKFVFSCGRRRVGRGGRLFIDRRPVLKYDKDCTAQWKFDEATEEIRANEVVVMEDTIRYYFLRKFEFLIFVTRNLAYRAFHLSPANEDINLFLTKPTHPDQINPKPIPDAAAPPNRPQLPVYEVVRQTVNAPTASNGTSAAAVDGSSTKKKAVATAPPSAAPTKPKKPLPVLDERTQKLKSMLDSSKSQAQLLKNQAAAAASGGAVGPPPASGGTPGSSGTVQTPIQQNQLPQQPNGTATSAANGGSMSPAAANLAVNINAANGAATPNVPNGAIPSAAALAALQAQQQATNAAQFSMLTAQQQMFLRQQALAAMMMGMGNNNLPPQTQQQQAQLLLAMRQQQAAAVAFQNMPPQMQQQYLMNQQRLRFAMAQAAMTPNSAGVGAVGGPGGAGMQSAVAAAAGMMAAGANVGGLGMNNPAMMNGMMTPQQMAHLQFLMKQKAAAAAAGASVNSAGGPGADGSGAPGNLTGGASLGVGVAEAAVVVLVQVTTSITGCMPACPSGFGDATEAELVAASAVEEAPARRLNVAMGAVVAAVAVLAIKAVLPSDLEITVHPAAALFCTEIVYVAAALATAVLRAAVGTALAEATAVAGTLPMMLEQRSSQPQERQSPELKVYWRLLNNPGLLVMLFVVSEASAEALAEAEAPEDPTVKTFVVLVTCTGDEAVPTTPLIEGAATLDARILANAIKTGAVEADTTETVVADEAATLGAVAASNVVSTTEPTTDVKTPARTEAVDKAAAVGPAWALMEPAVRDFAAVESVDIATDADPEEATEKAIVDAVLIVDTVDSVLAADSANEPVGSDEEVTGAIEPASSIKVDVEVLTTAEAPAANEKLAGTAPESGSEEAVIEPTDMVATEEETTGGDETSEKTDGTGADAVKMVALAICAEDATAALANTEDATGAVGEARACAEDATAAPALAPADEAIDVEAKTGAKVAAVVAEETDVDVEEATAVSLV
ncbi:Enhancer of polycomb-like protein 1 [Entophlyctis luteolus]|nr:Enhancer of polycomb-like protein 1 [Entophlyctis luteolus]